MDSAGKGRSLGPPIARCGTEGLRGGGVDFGKSVWSGAVGGF